MSALSLGLGNERSNWQGGLQFITNHSSLSMRPRQSCSPHFREGRILAVFEDFCVKNGHTGICMAVKKQGGGVNQFKSEIERPKIPVIALRAESVSESFDL